MKQLSRFKVIQNTLVYGDYKISLAPYRKFTVYYQDKEIFSSDEKDTLEDVIEVIFELEKKMTKILKTVKHYNYVWKRLWRRVNESFKLL